MIKAEEKEKHARKEAAKDAGHKAEEAKKKEDEPKEE